MEKELTPRHIPKLETLLGTPFCPEEGGAIRDTTRLGAIPLESPPGSHLAWREWAALGNPLCFPQCGEFKASCDFCLLLSARDWKCSFHCGPILGTAQVCLAGTC